jgi:hypothetical protein
MAVALLLQNDVAELAGLAAFSFVWVMCWIVIAVFVIAALWKVFEKAGKPGWAAIVPIYNIIIMLQIAGKPEWWVLLYLVPLVNLIVNVIVCIAIARRFGKGEGFGIGLAFLGLIFWPILGFGKAEYRPA